MRALPLAIALSLGACTDPAPVPQAPAGATEPGLADAQALVAGSWAADLNAESVAAAVVLEGPTGEGWIALFHGDLAGAERVFASVLSSDPASGSARLGLARVHLAHADAYEVAGRLHAETAAALATYRAEHRDRVRLGPYERRLARLLFPAGAAPSDEGGAPAIAGELATVAALDALVPGPGRGTQEPPRGLPSQWAGVLSFSGAVHAGQPDKARPLLAPIRSGGPDLVDPLGRDEETGLRFESAFFDPLRLQALTSFHAQEALRLAGGLPGLGEQVAAMSERFMPIRPAAAALAALPEPASQAAAPPALFLTFGGPWIDSADFAASDGSSPGALSARLAQRLPEWFGGAPSPRSVDRELRAVEALEALFGDALGPGLAAELQAPRLLGDAILRRRMVVLSDTHPTLALRLGRRSLDANPGALGGASDSSRTRVSYRNDRGFLLRLARQLWKAGQPGEALDLVHPLAQEDRALQPVVHYLGQLDAANSVGTAGKASQL